MIDLMRVAARTAVIVSFAVCAGTALGAEAINIRKARLQQESNADFNEGAKAYNEGKTDLAIEKFNAVISQNILPPETMGRAFLTRGLAYVAKKECGSADSDLNRANELLHENALAYAAKSQCAEIAGDPQKSGEFLDKAIALDPQNDSYLTLRCVNKFNRKDYAGALADCENSLAIKPNIENALAAVGQSSEMLGQKDKARATYSKMLQLRSDNKIAIEGLKRIGG